MTEEKQHKAWFERQWLAGDWTGYEKEQAYQAFVEERMRAESGPSRLSRSQAAADWIKESPNTRTISDAVREFGISWASIQRAVKMDARRCECCGQVIRNNHVKRK